MNVAFNLSDALALAGDHLTHHTAVFLVDRRCCALVVPRCTPISRCLTTNTSISHFYFVPDLLFFFTKISHSSGHDPSPRLRGAMMPLLGRPNCAQLANQMLASNSHPYVSCPRLAWLCPACRHPYSRSTPKPIDFSFTLSSPVVPLFEEKWI